MEEPIAKRLRNARKGEINLVPLSDRIKEILEVRNESLRAAGLKAGLDHQFIRRIVNGERPNMIACIMLADYFGINPNELLELAQWPTLKIFDIAHGNSKKQIAPEAVDLALELTEIESADSRRNLTSALRAIVNEFRKHK